MFPEQGKRLIDYFIISSFIRSGGESIPNREIQFRIVNIDIFDFYELELCGLSGKFDIDIIISEQHRLTVMCGTQFQ